MPSAGSRAKLSSDLWPTGCHSPGYCVQASPVQPDTEDVKPGRHTPRKAYNSNKMQSSKRQRTVSARGASTTPPPRRGSCENLKAGGETVSSKSVENDAFAMEVPVAPHPNQLPLPPMEWLQPKSQSPLTVESCLQSVMACRLAA